MNIIKLDATPSTNLYLRDLLAKSQVENFTVVITENQTDGRGQRDCKWNSEPGTSLTFSVLLKDILTSYEDVFNLNIIASLSCYKALKHFRIPHVFVKWPNDILSVNKKIGGILIENIFKSHGDVYSIIGIGLNVNQKKFDNLPHASSLYKIVGHTFDKNNIFQHIINYLVFYSNKLRNHGAKEIREEYQNILFKKDKPVVFELPDKKRFVGIIDSVSDKGELVVKGEDDVLSKYQLKEITMLY